MSEVKRYAIDTLGRWEAIPVNAGFFVKFTDHAAALDAQRLRADTAEAELKNVRESHESMRADLVSTDAKLAAAEQRIAVLEARYDFLSTTTPYRFKKMQEAASTDGGDVIYFHADRFDAQIDAALNQKSEGESQEDRLDDEALQRRHDDERREYFSEDQ